MNLTAIIGLKEKIATSDQFDARERDFLLDCINEAIINRQQQAGEAAQIRQWVDGWVEKMTQRKAELIANGVGPEEAEERATNEVRMQIRRLGVGGLPFLE